MSSPGGSGTHSNHNIPDDDSDIEEIQYQGLPNEGSSSSAQNSPSVVRRRQTNTSGQSFQGHQESNQRRTRDDSSRQDVSVFTEILRFFSIPVNFVLDTVFRVLRFALSIIRPDPRIRDPVYEINQYIEVFESSYGTRHPVFYRGAYSASLAEAKKDLKFLLVYLHSPSHQDTPDFCKNILIHPEVVSYITRNNLLFWSSSIESAEGHRASLALREHSYPFLALIVLKDNRMVVVRRWEGLRAIMSVEALLGQLQQGIEDNEAALHAARAEREERNMNQIIRQQQDQDYQESLELDRKKEQQKQEEKRKKEEEERLRKQKESDEKDKRNRLIALREESGRKLEPEPEEGPSDPSDVIRVLIKLPDGTRLERRFLRQTSIKYLYFFVFSQPKSPLLFQITTNFPRKELPCQSPSLENPDCKVRTGDEERDPPTFAEVGLGKSEMLFVHDLEA